MKYQKRHLSTIPNFIRGIYQLFTPSVQTLGYGSICKDNGLNSANKAMNFELRIEKHKGTHKKIDEKHTWTQEASRACKNTYKRTIKLSYSESCVFIADQKSFKWLNSCIL